MFKVDMAVKQTHYASLLLTRKNTGTMHWEQDRLIITNTDDAKQTSGASRRLGAVTHARAVWYF